MGHVVGHDGNLVVIEDLKQLGVVADDAGGDNLLALPVTGGQSLQLGVKGLQFGCVVVLNHKPGGAQHGGAADCGHHVGVLAGQLDKLPAGGPAAVVYLDSLPQGLVGDGVAGNLLQLLLHMLVLVHGELQAKGGLALLGMGQEDAGQLILHGHPEVLAHGAQGVADGGGDDAVQLVQRAVQQHLQRKLGDGAVEGGAVLLGQRNGLFVAAPDGHGDHAGGINQLLRGVVGQNADDLLALLLVGGQQTVGVLRGLLKFPN